MAKEIKRTLKTMPDTGITTNSPNDFFNLDFHFSYYLPETKGRIEEAVNELYVKLGKILDEDREAAGKPRGCAGTESGHTVSMEEICIANRDLGNTLQGIEATLKRMENILLQIESISDSKYSDEICKKCGTFRSFA